MIAPNDIDQDLLILTAKARQHLAERRELIVLDQYWYVEGERFYSEEAALAEASHLAKLLGCKIEVLTGLGDARMKRCGVATPGRDAEVRCRRSDRRVAHDFVLNKLERCCS